MSIFKQNIYFAHSLDTNITDDIYVAYSFANSFTNGPKGNVIDGGNKIFKYSTTTQWNYLGGILKWKGKLVKIRCQQRLKFLEWITILTINAPKLDNQVTLITPWKSFIVFLDSQSNLKIYHATSVYFYHHKGHISHHKGGPTVLC